MKRSLSLLLCTLALTFMLVSKSVAQDFAVEGISDSLWARMQGVSVPEGAAIQRSELRHLRIRHVDFEGKEHNGELVCNASIADDLLDIFRQLYEARYPIASVRLIDDFGADDETSMRANNTSCFCWRNVAGSTKPSKHSLGIAIDINPLQNPCVRTKRDGTRVVQPSTAGRYVNRNRPFAGRITSSDLAYRLFTSHGFRWGGSWRSLKDYQHFEK